MDDNNLVTHGLHWLTMTSRGWECAHPDCGWQLLDSHIGHENVAQRIHQNAAQRLFDQEHAKLSEAEASVQP